ncbi:MAG: LysM peptidoglycan-binding domain-containing protein [Crocinitomicaceae bacterium]|nr:LysM peptidoglycan-binding domain-containing protein [Crocinitomicaceae bacterium]
MKQFLGAIFILFSVIAFAQPEDAVIKTIDGKQFYVHTVAQGNTLYGIHKLYNTDVEKILAANPGLNDNLTIGQQVFIPIEGGAVNTSGKSHTVEQGETLYGISKKYNCTVQQLKDLNPGIETGLQIGQKIKIPVGDGNVGEVIQDDPVEKVVPSYKISYTDSIVDHTVLAHETLYSISKRYMVSSDTIRILNNLDGTKVKKGDVLRIPVKKVNYSVLQKIIDPIVKDSNAVHVPIQLKKEYKVALMLPFMLAQNDAEMSKILKIGQTRELLPTTKIAFEFYQGFMLAADSLKKAGLNLTLYVYDTAKDTATIAQIMDKEEFKDIDLVVGPLFKNTISYTAKKCKEKNIRIVLPFKTDPKVLHDNPLAFKTVTSNMTLLDGSVDYILSNHAKHNVIILKPYSDGDKALYDRAKERFNEGIAKIPSYNGSIVELSLGNSGGRELNEYIKKDTTNVVIIPSADVKFVSGALMRLNSVMNMNPYAKNLKIIAFGFEDWNKYDELDMLQRNRLNQHYSTYRFVDLNSVENVNFVRSFRHATGVDPTVYSCQGFDVGMYFLGALYTRGVSFEQALDSYQIDLIQNDFDFKEIVPGSGFENTNVQIIRYDDFELKSCTRK